MIDVWDKCEGNKHFNLIDETAWRIADESSTRKLVDSLEEQSVLEELIEINKPQLTDDLLNYHPLLYTPFRYPSLKHGSRFGNPIEPSIWYGSIHLKTALAEKAFQQLNFLHASHSEYDIVQRPLTLFSVAVKTQHGIHLEDKPFEEYQKIISSPSSYETSQLLGAAMREAKVEAFTYLSARNAKEINIGLFTAKAFQHKKPNVNSFQTWQCHSTLDVVEFVRSNSISSEVIRFSVEDFMVNNKLPMF